MPNALEDLYAVFGRVQRPARVRGCPHCVDRDEDRRLLDGPVRSIAAEDLARYAAKALTTWGDTSDFRYFLPRLLECAAADMFGYPNPPIVFGKLAIAGWLGWSTDERTAVQAFLTEWWTETLEHYPSRLDLGTVVCCLAHTGIDLASFLDLWGRLETVDSIRHLHSFVFNDVEWGCDPPRLNDVFWKQVTGQQQIITWLTGGSAATAVETAFDAESREEVLRLLDEIHPAVRPA